ncbi:hypothetical protein CMO93_04485 [Candidatus Woesearchaeota archaeon]|nr:hypothetical protein [Candidatus Woesearchaeota archaeon]|tara:strand:- start:1502 stop:2035 length:534 start_codon:yes stop_codon:yes gene_type:complete
MRIEERVNGIMHKYRKVSEQFVEGNIYLIMDYFSSVLQDDAKRIGLRECGLDPDKMLAEFQAHPNKSKGKLRLAFSSNADYFDKVFFEEDEKTVTQMDELGFRFDVEADDLKFAIHAMLVKSDDEIVNILLKTRGVYATKAVVDAPDDENSIQDLIETMLYYLPIAAIQEVFRRPLH